MDARTVKVCVVCALGAFVGTIIAMEINHYFWWVGTLVGFAVGYLGYDHRQALDALWWAWDEMVVYRPQPTTLFWWRHVCPMLVLGLMLITATIVGAVFLGSLVLCWLDYEVTCKALSDFAICYVVVTGVLGAVLSVAFGSSNFDECFRKKYNTFSQLRKCLVSRRFFRGLALRFNPVSVLCYWVWVGLGRACYCMAIGLPSLCRFMKRFFVLIHSDERLLCGVDTAIGVTVGFACGNALIGALVGAVVGVINFELVSKRWLKCVPVASS